MLAITIRRLCVCVKRRTLSPRPAVYYIREGTSYFGLRTAAALSVTVLEAECPELRIGIYNLGEAPEEKHKSREEAATSDWQEIALSGSHFIAHRHSHSQERKI